MPACFCPHCKTRLWVKETQLNVAQGFVVCQNAKGCLKPKTIWQARKNLYSTICPKLFRMSNSSTASARTPLARNRFPATKSPISSTAVQPCTIRRPQPPLPHLPPHRRFPYRPPVRKGSTGLLQPCSHLSSSLCSFPTSSSYERARQLCRPLPRSRPYIRQMRGTTLVAGIDGRLLEGDLK